MGTDEYRRNPILKNNIGGTQVDIDWPHIFIGAATSPTNIIHVYSSVTWPHHRIYGGKADRVWPPYIHRLTDEYRRARFETDATLSHFFFHSAVCIVTAYTAVSAATRYYFSLIFLILGKLGYSR
jgi:hypothetical protein